VTQAYEYTLRSFEQEAAQILTRARDAARRVLRDALAEAERLKAQAAAQGRQEGLAQGLQQGAAQAQKRVAEETRTLAEALRNAAREVEARQAELIHLAHRDLVELALAIAERIVRARIQVDPAVAARAVEQAASLAGRRHSLTVHLNPTDHQALAPADTASVRTVADESVARGGCVVRTDVAEFDARIETQLQTLREALLG
jgi:flagellar assembly protein FliH